jgi:hypothetical protein
MIGILRWLMTSQWIHILHLSKPEIEPQNPELLLTGRRVPTKTESVSESILKITGECLRLQLFICQPELRKLPRENRALMRSATAKRILEEAKEAFTRSSATASLDDIAKEAGVGAGTLHRHFPARDALIEAVYRTKVEKLAAAQKKFSESLPPIEALRAWILLFVDLPSGT